ncbi:MAG: CvpA family protein [Prolixibacteraceae bacterium]|jgi:membrane protein required for colicin V production|nr:CvpA family protein [Prolixibacteraceae bacterium]
MNYIDLIIIILLVISAVKGATKGFIYEIASLAALIAGVWGAVKFSGATEAYLVNRLNFTNQYINIIAFVITLLIIIVVIHFIGKAIEKIIQSISLGVINRLLGLVFSVIKTAFILGIVILLLEKIDENVSFMPKDKVQESRLYSPLQNLTISIFPFMIELYENIKEKQDDTNDEEEPDDRKNEKPNLI